MKKITTVITLLASGIFVSGCSYSGTTYGTGSTHELATVKGLSSIFRLKPKDSEKIIYQPRPDLVMPSNINNLPTPVDQANNNVENWPVTPEQRQAALQAATPDLNTNNKSSGILPEEANTSSTLFGPTDSVTRNRIRKTSRKNTRSSGADDILKEIQSGTANAQSAAIQAQREQLTYTKGAGERRFLTEPPTEYRTPAATAEAGDLGIDRSELSERQKRQKKLDKDLERGVITPGT